MPTGARKSKKTKVAAPPSRNDNRRKQIHTSVPSWLYEMIDARAKIAETSTGDIACGWLMAHAGREFPGTVPTVGAA